jgi:formamidopyrimidine-DNA glycosylase
MPELPEVEVTRRGLAPHVEGRRVDALVIYDRRLRWPVPRSLPRAIVGRTIERLDRRSKYLLFRVGDDTMLVHLGMTGSLRAFARPPARGTHDHFDLKLDSGMTLRYHDPRRFGALLWLAPPGDDHPLLAHLGPEPFAMQCTADYLHAVLRGRTTPIKLALMNNEIIAGVGNIYANESLFRAGIRPTLPAQRVSRARLQQLIVHVRATLDDALRKGGSTLRDFVDSAGEPGYFQLDYFVYGREGQACRVCGTAIKSVRLGGRATNYCPRCQR